MIFSQQSLNRIAEDLGEPQVLPQQLQGVPKPSQKAPLTTLEAYNATPTVVVENGMFVHIVVIIKTGCT